MMVVLFPGTRTTTKVTTQNIENNTENRLRKTTNLLLTVIFGVTLHNEDIGKEWLRSGKNALDFRQQAKDSLNKLER